MEMIEFSFKSPYKRKKSFAKEVDNSIWHSQQVHKKQEQTTVGVTKTYPEIVELLDGNVLIDRLVTRYNEINKN